MKNILLWLITGLLQLLSLLAFSQTGPAGIEETSGSSNLVMWLDASDLSLSNGSNISTWTDQSGYGNHAYSDSGNEPTYNTSWENGMPSISFNVFNSEYLYVPNSSSTRINKHTIYIVGEVTDNSDNWATLLVKADDFGWENGYGMYKENTSDFFYVYDQDYFDYATYIDIYYSEPFIANHMFNKNKVKSYLDGGNYENTDYFDGNINNSTNNLYIGCSPDYSSGVTGHIDGDIAEVIIFDKHLKAIERKFVDNYLSSKYGISIPLSNDYYDYDGTHNMNVHGIGRKNGSQIISSSQGKGILEISNASSLGNNDYLFVGHNNASLTATYDDAPNEYTYRLNRSWRADVTNSPGTISMSFDIAGLGFPTDASEYALLIDDDGDFSNATIHTTGANYSGGKISFTGVSLSSGNYITIAALNSITWDGVSFANGSGTSNRPDATDGDRKFYVYGSGATLSTAASVRSMVISGSGQITLNSGGELTVTNDIENDGTVNVSAGASLHQTHNGSDQNSGSGTYNVSQTGSTSSLEFNAFSSPTKNSSITTTFSSINPCDIYIFDGNNQEWTYDYASGYSTSCNGSTVTFGAANVISGGDGNMDVARGYFVPGAATSTKTFSGSLHNGDYAVPIYQKVNPSGVNWSGDDWNLVGNPYPGGLNATAFWNENAVNNTRITDAIYFWDDDNSEGAGYDENDDYASWNLMGGTASSNEGGNPNGTINVAQGFWVIANSSTSIVFNNSMRSGQTAQFYKQAENPVKNAPKAWISVSNSSGYYNQVLVGFSNYGSDDIDAYDAIKLSGNDHISLSTMSDTTKLIIQSLPSLQLEQTKVIPLYLKSTKEGVHTFKIDDLFDLDNAEILLEDRVSLKTYDLKSDLVAMYLSGKQEYANRFFLNITKKDSDSDGTTSVNDKLSDNLKVRFVEQTLVYQNSKAEKGTLTLLDIQGRLILSKKIQSKQGEILTPELIPSVYTVTFTSDESDTIITKKVIK